MLCGFACKPFREQSQAPNRPAHLSCPGQKVLGMCCKAQRFHSEKGMGWSRQLCRPTEAKCGLHATWVSQGSAGQMWLMRGPREGRGRGRGRRKNNGRASLGGGEAWMWLSPLVSLAWASWTCWFRSKKASIPFLWGDLQLPPTLNWKHPSSAHSQSGGGVLRQEWATFMCLFCSRQSESGTEPFDIFHQRSLQNHKPSPPPPPSQGCLSTSFKHFTANWRMELTPFICLSREDCTSRHVLTDTCLIKIMSGCLDRKLLGSFSDRHVKCVV